MQVARASALAAASVVARRAQEARTESLAVALRSNLVQVQADEAVDEEVDEEHVETGVEGVALVLDVYCVTGEADTCRLVVGEHG